MSTSSPIIGIMQAGQTVEEMAVIGQRAVRDIASKFQLALQTFNNLDKAADTTSAEQEQERIANFQEQITTLHGTVATIRSAYQSCLRSPNSDGNCESSDHLVSEKERLLQLQPRLHDAVKFFLDGCCNMAENAVCKELHDISSLVQQDMAHTQELLWTLTAINQNDSPPLTSGSEGVTPT